MSASPSNQQSHSAGGGGDPFAAMHARMDHMARAMDSMHASFMRGFGGDMQPFGALGDAAGATTPALQDGGSHERSAGSAGGQLSTRNQEQGLGQLAPFRSFGGMPVDLKEDDARFVLSADVPGCGKEDVDVQIHDNHVTITAAKKHNKEETGGDDASGKWHRREQSFGRTSRTLRLPPGVDADSISGGVADGVLTLHLPKVEGGSPAPRKLQLQ